MDGKAPPKTLSDVFQKVDIALDGYDDLFSDFDPSPYATRILSEDFLNELFRRYSQTPKGRIVVNFTVPRSARSEKTESLIRKRLKDHFRERDKTWDGRMRERVRLGLIRLAIGAVVSAAILLFPELDVPPILTLLSVLVWYFMWTGFDSLIEVPMRLQRKKVRADQFLAADYNFFSQEDVVQSIQKLAEAPPQKPEPAQKPQKIEPEKKPQPKEEAQKPKEAEPQKAQPKEQPQNPKP